MGPSEKQDCFPRPPLSALLWAKGGKEHSLAPVRDGETLPAPGPQNRASERLTYL